jgi:hypothetical protein
MPDHYSCSNWSRGSLVIGSVATPRQSSPAAMERSMERSIGYPARRAIARVQAGTRRDLTNWC